MDADAATADSFDTLIIGAGAAGLAAARLLAGAGRRVAVVEARDRIGGRIFTRHIEDPLSSESVPIELGAEFIHGLPGETWALVHEGHLATVELEGSRLVMRKGRLQKQDGRLDAAFEVLRKLETWAPTPSGTGDMTFAEFLQTAKIDGAQAETAAEYVEGFNAADRDVIGVAALAKQQKAEDAIHGDRIFRVQAGYDLIPQLLASGMGDASCPVFLKRKVDRIAWSSGSVTASGTDDRNRRFTLRGLDAIITLPLSVLQAGAVDFEPEPSDVISQARRLRMGAALRATLVFRSRFWREGALTSGSSGLKKELERLSFLFTPQRVPATWWTAMPNPAPVLTGWVGGPRAAELQARVRDSADPDLLLRECLSVLATAFGRSEIELRRLLVSWHSHDWDADELALGAYSYVPAGALDAAQKLSIPVRETLYFAGEHTDIVGEWGTVHGALRSGLRAARQILATAR
ncbi:MAG TPA: NAD(P)/FAD-dependent oxidoreductase [Steroidobacteraceae bacterium]|nr:NAD(P)/FAD-dependent oxidoreductase [Steroidobacteraceae bacterium]